jgi:hypothetical protein
MNWHPHIIDFRLYTQKSITIATFLGGPLIGGYMLARNLWNLDKHKWAVISLLIGLGLTVAALIYGFSTPAYFQSKVPLLFIAPISASMIFILIELFHNKDIQQFLVNGGKKASTKTAALIGVLGFVLLGFIVSIHVFTREAEYEIMTFGNLEHQVLYNEAVPPEEIQRLGNFLLEQEYFNNFQKRSVVFLSKDHHYELKLISDTRFWGDPEINLELQVMETLLNSAGFYKNVQLKLTDQYLASEKDI